MPYGPIGPIHHLASSPVWRPRLPTPPVPMDENIESTHPFPEDFEGPGSINEVLIPYYLCLLNYS